MKTPPLNLKEVYINAIAELYAAEKKYEKAFEQLSLTAHTPELGSALSPERTEIEQHISRLAIIMEPLKLKPSRITNAIDDELLKLSKEASGFAKQQSVLKDIQLLHCARSIQHHKIAAYESLYLMAQAMKKEPAAALLEQSLKDNINTERYLVQLAQNVIYPAAALSEAD